MQEIDVEGEVIMYHKILFLFLLLGCAIRPYYADAQPFFSDGFESGDLKHTENLTRWASTSTQNGSITVSTEKAHTGSKSLKFKFNGVPTGTDDWAEQRFLFGENKTEVYIQYYVYFPLNYKQRNDIPSNNKTILVWDDESNYLNSRVKMGAEFWRNSTTGLSYIEAKAAFDFNTTPVELTCRTGTGSKISNVQEYVPNFGRWELTADHLGKWLCFEWHLKMDDGSGNGALELFVDGVKQFGRNDLKYAGAPCAPGYFKAGYLFGWSNSGFDEDTVIYVDDVAFSDSYIGNRSPSKTTGVLIKPQPVPAS